MVLKVWKQRKNTVVQPCSGVGGGGGPEKGDVKIRECSLPHRSRWGMMGIYTGLWLWRQKGSDNTRE